MVKKLGKRILPFMLAVLLVVSVMPFSAFATNVTVLDGQISITDSKNTGKVSNGIYTATAAGSLFGKATNTITITNDSGSKAAFKFDYTVDKASSFTIDGGTSATSGSYSILLEAGGTIALVVTSNSGFSNTTATLTMSNFSLTAAANASDVTFEFDSTYGSVTVGGDAITSGHTQTGVSATEGVAVVATPVSGATFLGWVDAADNMILSTAASYTVTPAQAMTVKAVFVGADSKQPHFMIGALDKKSYKHGLLGMSTGYYWTVSKGTYLFEDLAAAAAASEKSTNSKGIVLLNNGTLPAGTYTIPAGSTFVVPFDSSNTLYKTEAQGRERVQNSSDPTKDETYTHGYTVYRNLTMADGAHIVLNGDMCVPAKHLYAQGAATGGGSPVDNVAMVTMQDNSSITINNGGSLYAYGFITGSGSVVANSGANVYEYFQFTDFRGGDQSTQMKNGVFPVSQYYVQNIEVPLTLYHGASEYSFTTLYMSASAMASSVKFISSSGAMFNLTDGYVTKRYDGSTDRLIIEFEGEMNVSPIKMDMGTSSLDSEKYELPVNSNISITAKNGSVITMNQDVAMLPGSEIIIEQGANATIAKDVSVYIYGVGDWSTYAGAINRKVIPVINAPGRTYNRTEADLTNARIVVDGFIDASLGYVYTTASGADITSNGTGVALMTAGSETVTYQVIQAAKPKDSNYVAIPITPAKLTNADGTIISTGTDTYTYSDDKWNCTNHSYGDWIIDTEAECEKLGAKHRVCVACSVVENEMIEALIHEYGEEVVHAPTCTEAGYVTTTCSKCGDVKKVESGEAATGHSYTSAVTEPTCTEQGYTTYTCTVCGYSYKDNYVAAKGHSYDDWAVRTDAGCESEGEEYRTCAVCNFEDTRAISAKGHSYTTVVTAPTCTEQGYITHTCTACSYSYDDTYVAATGHSMGDWIIDTNATCEEKGTKHKDCSVCDYTETEEISAIGHSYTTVVTAPTCTAEGYTTHTCANCSDSYIDTYVAATGHKYGDWEVVTAPTHTKEGLKQHTCHCGHTETAVISVIICDIDEEGVGAAELTKMRKFILGTEVPTAEEVTLFDMSDDGVISIKDLVKLKKYIADISN